MRQNRAVHLGPPVPEDTPRRARRHHGVEVEAGQQHGLAPVVGVGDNRAGLVGNEGGAIERNLGVGDFGAGAAGVGGRGLDPDAVGRD